MPFEIVRNDITKMQVDAIVNTANPYPIIGAGTDAGIHAKAGPKLLEAREKIGIIGVGEAAITPAFDLEADYVIHTVGPVWKNGEMGEERLLRRCYTTSLNLAAKHGCKSIAFPLISTGVYGFPKDLALQVAIGAISKFLLQQEMQVYLVVFHREAFRLSEQLFHRVVSYIDEHYVEEKKREEYGNELEDNRLRGARRKARMQADIEMMRSISADACVPMEEPRPAERKAKPSLFGAAKPKPIRLDDLLEKTDAGFSETLLKLIAASGKKPSEIYNRANVSKQHFSKISNNPAYQPKKTTAVAFAIALKLDLAQTQDLIGRAGYALTNSSKFDVIIKFFIEQKNYDLFEINATLFEFDQSLLGV